VVAELDSWLADGGEADFITFSGSGEPTLHSGFGDIIDAVHARCGTRVALLTNGSLLALPRVRRDAARADVVKASLSAWDQASFEMINRPVGGMGFETLVEGLRAFRREFQAQFWLEVFVVAGVNSDREGLGKIAALAASVSPDRIHLNTAVRPPAEKHVVAVTSNALEEYASLFTPTAEVIADWHPEPGTAWETSEAGIMAMLARRPCRAEDIAATFGLDASDAAKRLGRLLEDGTVQEQQRDGSVYYVLQGGMPPVDGTTGNQ